MQDNKHIFLSYSRVDTKFASRVASDLRERDFDVWMDQSNISGGKHWDKTIEEALKHASFVVLIISKASVNSENVKDEISFAKNRGITIIPVLYQEAETPLGWSRLHWIDMKRDYREGLEELTASIKGDALDVSRIKTKKSFYWFYKLLLAFLMLIMIGLIYLFFFTKKEESPNLHLHSIKVDKDNIIIIGNNNEDINITLE